MPVSQFRCAGPMKITNCTAGELKVLREAVFSPESKVKEVMINIHDKDTAFVCARSSVQLSAAMWAKQLGVPRLQAAVVQCTDGVEQVMRACRAEWGMAKEDEEVYTSQSCAAGDGSNKKRSKKQQQEEENESSGGEDTGSGGEEMMVDSEELTPTKKACTAATVVPPAAATTSGVVTSLLQTLLDHRFEKWIGVVAPKLAWDKFNQLAVFWYFRSGSMEFASPNHMPIICQAMREHPQSHSGWSQLVTMKMAEANSSGDDLAPVDTALLKRLLKQRLSADEAIRLTPAQMWARVEEWAGQTTAESNKKNTVIQAVCEHCQSDIERRIHAVKQNSFQHVLVCDQTTGF